MKPSVCASLLVFLFVGCVNGRDFLEQHSVDRYVQWVLLSVILFSGLYFYYVNISTDQWAIKKDLQRYRILSWLITVGQYVGFSLLWTLVKLGGFTWYATLLLTLNLSYLLWDWLHWNTVRQEKNGFLMLTFDIIGCVLSGLLLVATLTLPPSDMYNSELTHQAMGIGIVATLLVAASVIGLFLCYYNFSCNPFKLVWIDNSSISWRRDTDKKDRNPGE